MTRAVVLMSGGLDSTVTSFIAKSEGKEIFPLSFDYRQRHIRELYCVLSISSCVTNRALTTIVVPSQSMGDLLGSESSLFKVSVNEPSISGSSKDEIPNTWVPQRNMLFLTYAFILAESVGAEEVWAGFNAVDYSGYPDCRPEFIQSAEIALNLGRRAYIEESREIKIETPLIKMSKREIIEKGIDLNVPFELTYSCYYGRSESCGKCDSCRIRLEGFDNAGLHDPIAYAAGVR